MEWRPDWAIIRSLFRFGLPTGVQGIAMNIAGVLMLRFIGSLEQSAAAQAAFAIGYTQLFSLITWTSVGLMGASATIAGQNLGAGHPERAMQGVNAASRIGLGVAAVVGVLFIAFPQPLLWVFDAATGDVGVHRASNCCAISPFPDSSSRSRSSIPAACRARATRAARCSSPWPRRWSSPSASASSSPPLRQLEPTDIWLAIVLGHFARCGPLGRALPPGEMAAHQNRDRRRARLTRRVRGLKFRATYLFNGHPSLERYAALRAFFPKDHP